MLSFRFKKNKLCIIIQSKSKRQEITTESMLLAFFLSFEANIKIKYLSGKNLL